MDAAVERGKGERGHRRADECVWLWTVGGAGEFFIENMLRGGQHHQEEEAAAAHA